MININEHELFAYLEHYWGLKYWSYPESSTVASDEIRKERSKAFLDCVDQVKQYIYSHKK